MFFADACDEEVAELAASHVSDDSCTSSSTDPTEHNLTAESVQQLMKTVNRCR